jgi:putative endonuclease
MIRRLLARLRSVADRDLPKNLQDARRGEDLAFELLRAHGYRVIARNYRARSGRGELDLIGWDGEFLACVEVKARKNADFGRPETFVDSAKRRRVISAAFEFARRANVHTNRLRFDVVSVVLSDPPQVELLRNAFSEQSEAERRRRWR